MNKYYICRNFFPESLENSHDTRELSRQKGLQNHQKRKYSKKVHFSSLPITSNKKDWKTHSTRGHFYLHFSFWAGKRFLSAFIETLHWFWFLPSFLHFIPSHFPASPKNHKQPFVQTLHSHFRLIQLRLISEPEKLS